MDGIDDRCALAAPTGVLRRVRPPGDGAWRPALAPVHAACRRCGFSVHGFLNGTTCVLQIDGRTLQAACEAAGSEAHACAGLREAVRAARRP
ncbi:hypothetical protein SAMN02799631_00601 [Methylobacterium sp. 174MFSha1.1]|uniref:hypothetical protein n=1 Tax=Methylobacterium sp. 174MFSha1.1 TaxID=1502749 RepID=UPI0008EE9082|nr:hypothetical protein [Methylobacterium sp. 174MFSha1.1]SFU42147.1 hypothetical protein SAMN02799631_00601 [Methylobacterium sp. 174MFSha1.1]